MECVLYDKRMFIRLNNGGGFEKVRELKNATRFPSMGSATMFIDHHHKHLEDFRPISIKQAKMELAMDNRDFKESCQVENYNKLSSEELDGLIKSSDLPKFKKDLYLRQRYTAEERANLYNESGGICAICGEPIDLLDFTIDHIIPISSGMESSNDPSNLQCTCWNCNQFKGSNSMGDTWIKAKHIVIKLMPDQIPKWKKCLLKWILK